MLPTAKSEGLISYQAGDESIVYDVPGQAMHRLSPLASTVWTHCDGSTSVAGLASVVREKLRIPLDEKAVWLTLKELSSIRLLQEPVKLPRAGGYSRRAMIAVLAGVAGLFPLCETVSGFADCTGECDPDGAGGCDQGDCDCNCYPVTGTDERDKTKQSKCLCQRVSPNGFPNQPGCTGGCPAPTFTINRKGATIWHCPPALAGGCAAPCSCKLQQNRSVFCVCVMG